jgi:hypothetical protein
MSVSVPTAPAGNVGDYSTPATDLKPAVAVNATAAATAAPAANATAAK